MKEEAKIQIMPSRAELRVFTTEEAIVIKEPIDYCYICICMSKPHTHTHAHTTTTNEGTTNN